MKSKYNIPPMQTLKQLPTRMDERIPTLLPRNCPNNFFICPPVKNKVWICGDTCTQGNVSIITGPYSAAPTNPKEAQKQITATICKTN